MEKYRVFSLFIERILLIQRIITKERGWWGLYILIRPIFLWDDNYFCFKFKDFSTPNSLFDKLIKNLFKYDFTKRDLFNHFIWVFFQWNGKINLNIYKQSVRQPQTSYDVVRDQFYYNWDRFEFTIFHFSWISVSF